MKIVFLMVFALDDPDRNIVKFLYTMQMFMFCPLVLKKEPKKVVEQVQIFIILVFFGNSARNSQISQSEFNFYAAKISYLESE